MKKFRRMDRRMDRQRDEGYNIIQPFFKWVYKNRDTVIDLKQLIQESLGSDLQAKSNILLLYHSRSRIHNSVAWPKCLSMIIWRFIQGPDLFVVLTDTPHAFYWCNTQN